MLLQSQFGRDLLTQEFLQGASIYHPHVMTKGLLGVTKHSLVPCSHRLIGHTLVGRTQNLNISIFLDRLLQEATYWKSDVAASGFNADSRAEPDLRFAAHPFCLIKTPAGKHPLKAFFRLNDSASGESSWFPHRPHPFFLQDPHVFCAI